MLQTVIETGHRSYVEKNTYKKHTMDLKLPKLQLLPSSVSPTSTSVGQPLQLTLPTLTLQTPAIPTAQLPTLTPLSPIPTLSFQAPSIATQPTIPTIRLSTEPTRPIEPAEPRWKIAYMKFANKYKFYRDEEELKMAKKYFDEFINDPLNQEIASKEGVTIDDLYTQSLELVNDLENAIRQLKFRKADEILGKYPNIMKWKTPHFSWAENTVMIYRFMEGDEELGGWESRVEWLFKNGFDFGVPRAVARMYVEWNLENDKKPMLETYIYYIRLYMTTKSKILGTTFR